MSNFINKKTFEIRRSVHDPDMVDEPDWALLTEDIPSCERKYLKWNESDNEADEMTQDEKDVVDQTEADLIAQAQENAKDIDSLEKLTQALGLVILDEINILRTKASLTPRTVLQLKNAVKAKYETL